jgi:hypothetical protein
VFLDSAVVVCPWAGERWVRKSSLDCSRRWRIVRRIQCKVGL